MDRFVFHDTQIKLYNEDCLNVFSMLEHESIDLII